MHGCRGMHGGWGVCMAAGACMVAEGVCMAAGACMVAEGACMAAGACMVAGGVHGIRLDTVNERVVRILLEVRSCCVGFFVSLENFASELYTKIVCVGSL